MQSKEDVQEKYQLFINELEYLKESIGHISGVKNKQLTEIQNCFLKALEKEINNASYEMRNSIDGTVWDRLTIAFFGETNAGKSTIIETFRILCDKCRSENNDGNIVGDGSSDFTKQYEEYNLEICGMPFTLIDVPGIEGNEKAYTDGIKKALRRAHIVFYVHGDNNKPNTATASKIKDYLGDWVNVYTLYNVRASVDSYDTNEDRITLINDGVKECEQLIKDRFAEVLGEVYKGNFTLQAFLAMCAYAKFTPNRIDLVSKQKLAFKYFGTDISLMEFSQFLPVLNFIHLKSQNYLDEIIRANAQKMISMSYRVISHFEYIVSENKDGIKEFKESLKRFRNEIIGTFDYYKNNIYDEAETQINSFVYSLSREIYVIIDDTQDNKQLRIEERIMNRQQDLANYIPIVIERNIKELQSDIDFMKRRLNEKYTLNISKTCCNYNNNIHMDGVVSKLEIGWEDVGSLLMDVAGGALCGSYFTFIAPGVATAVGAVVGCVLHLLRKYIFGDGGKTEAKLEVSKSLEAYKKQLIMETEDKLKELYKSLEEGRDKIKDCINKELDALQELEDIIDNSKIEINGFANKLKINL